MPRYQRRYKKRARKPFRKTRKNTIIKMVGGAVNGGLKIASQIGGPIGAVARTVSMMRSMINTEAKTFDVSASDTMASNSAYSFPLNVIQKGDDDAEREGNKVLYKDWQLQITGKIATGATVTQGRYAVVYDKKPELGTPSWNSSNPVFSTNNILAYNHEDSGDRYVKLLDRKFDLNNNGRTSFQNKHFLKLPVHSIWDKDDTTGVAFQKGKIHIVGITNEDSVTGLPPTIQFNSRLNYYDN